MKRFLWILAAAAALALLAVGVYRATRPTVEVLTPEQAAERIEQLAVRFNAAVENERDVAPLIDEVEPIVEGHPDLRPGRKLLGQLYANEGRVDEAYGQFDAALAIDPQEPDLQNLAGTAAMMLGDAASAEAHHRRAVEQAPNRARLKVALADVLVKDGRHDEAESLLQAALEQDLELHEAAALLSDVHRARRGEGDGVAALEWMERAVAKLPIKPTTVETRMTYARKLARLYAERGEPMEAVAVLAALPDEQRFRPEVLADSAGYFEAAGRTALAGLEYELAADRNPADANLAADAARWYARGGDDASARAMLERVDRLNPQHPVLRDVELFRKQ